LQDAAVAVRERHSLIIEPCGDHAARFDVRILAQFEPDVLVRLERLRGAPHDGVSVTLNRAGGGISSQFDDVERPVGPGLRKLETDQRKFAERRAVGDGEFERREVGGLEWRGGKEGADREKEGADWPRGEAMDG